MAIDPRIDNLSFDEAINFFKNKIKIPTRRWTDLWKEMHSRGFMVAGAMKADILNDFYDAVKKSISEGMTLEEFREIFDEIVEKSGWDYYGSRNWRSRVIFETNLRTAYSAGRYEQMTDPDISKMRPYWEYRHGDSIHPRPLHLAWDGKILPADDTWWDTHYPPNGWGCKCKVFALSKRDLKRLGKDKPDKAPNDGMYQWTDKVTGITHTVPVGIDPGWDYNMGDAAKHYKPDLSKYPTELRKHLSPDLQNINKGGDK